MARQSLGDLLGKFDEKPPATAVPAEANESDVDRPAQSVEAPPRAAASRTPRPVPSSAAVKPVDLPTYLRLVRKETRLREDQQNQLTLEARKLNRAKAVGTPRITDNTLIRIAVDLLLDRVSRASGDDEASILRSLKQ